MIGKATLVIGALLLGYAMIRRSLSAGDAPKHKPIEAARRCLRCDAFVVGNNPSPCNRSDCPSRSA